MNASKHTRSPVMPLATTFFAAVAALVFMGMMAPPLDAAAQDCLEYGDLVYHGAFAFPAGDDWTYGGHALAYYPDGDPGGEADGHPGSLYVVGHAWNQLVGEISIPAPVLSDNYGELPRAGVLRPLADITGGMIGGCVYYDQAGTQRDCMYREVAGLEYLPEVGKIAWNMRDWYNVGGYDLDSMGWSALDLSGAQGVWHVGSRFDPVFHNARTCDYLFRAPASYASEHLGARRLISGNHRQAGAFGGSQGPTLYASGPWLDGNPPANRAEIGAVALVYYPEIIDCIDHPELCHYPGYRVDDAWGGGAWIEAGGESAILIFGRKGLGDNYYGDGQPGHCEASKGWHSDPYEPQILFYDPADIERVLAGTVNPWDVVPYAVHSPSDVAFNPECGRFVSVAHDAANQLIYVVESGAAQYGRMVVHVWQVQVQSEPSVPASSGFFNAVLMLLLFGLAFGVCSGRWVR